MLSYNKYYLSDERHEYTEVANATFVLIFKQWEERNFRTKYIKSIYPSIFKNNEIPLACVKTKVSQLRRYKTTGDTFRISPKLIDLYESLKDVSIYKLESTIKQVLTGFNIRYSIFYDLI
ncbi:hypothetical protein [Arcobacter aquimarinus]|uniref:Uncharacterized protein n=1 Tax=Arcobacter aquimarinus TaxID=1315211 RepID=A0AAE7B2Y3_9BACT|nr:hypothetical protein [Arcobacter aquimarinus]QKE26608.1 hypothetical protein AAQM_1872 [Arcobacter aquimarinus]RXI36569.1 hypothetical protein CP986_01680 [Arcobacter aquimarinus]